MAESELLEFHRAIDRSESTKGMYVYTAILYRDGASGGRFYMRVFRPGMSKADVDLEDLLAEVKSQQAGPCPGAGDVGGEPLLVDIAQVFPKLPPSFMSVEPQADLYVKKLEIGLYDNPAFHKARRDAIMSEANVLEELRRRPHPHIVKYLGCMVEHSRIVGFVLEPYKQTLLQRCLAKETPLKVGRCIAQIAAALAHLHDMGYCHNDVTPRNIMLKEDDTAVLIDFDSCQRMGETLLKGTAAGWRDDASRTSVVKNDWLGLALVENFLRKSFGANE